MPLSRVTFDAHQCEPTEDEFAAMTARLAGLAGWATPFPRHDLRVLVEWHGRRAEYAVKLTLQLPDHALVGVDSDQSLLAGFERCVAEVTRAAAAYRGRLGDEARAAEPDGTAGHFATPPVRMVGGGEFAAV